VFEFDINWNEHSGACEYVYVFGFVGPSYFSIQYKFPEKRCGEKGFTLTIDLPEGLCLWFVIEKFERPPVFSHQYPSHHVMITSCSQWGNCNAKIDSMSGDVWSPTMMLVVNALVTVWSYCFGNDTNGSAFRLSCYHVFAIVIGSSSCWRVVSGPVCCWFLTWCRLVVDYFFLFWCVSACLVGRSNHSRKWYFGIRVSGFPGCPIQVW
jgi:hypothetical protein